jgi:hypothetical protein
VFWIEKDSVHEFFLFSTVKKQIGQRIIFENEEICAADDAFFL